MHLVLQNDNCDMQLQLEHALELQQRQAKQQLEAVQTELKTTEQHVLELKQDVQSQEADNSLLRVELEQQLDVLATLRQEHSAQEIEVNSLKRHKERTDEVHETNEVALAELKAEVQKQTAEASELRKQFRDTTSQKTVADRKLRALQAEMDACVAKCTHFEQELGSLQAEYSHLTNAHEVTKRAASRATADAEQLSTERSDLSQQMETTDAALRDAVARHEQETDRNAHLQQAMKVLQDKENDLNQQNVVLQEQKNSNINELLIAKDKLANMVGSLACYVCVSDRLFVATGSGICYE